MKLIIAGSRSFNNYKLLKQEVEKYIVELGVDINDVIVVSGGARGADTLGEMFALENLLKIEYYTALWERYGKQAGYKRNVEMGDNADALIAFWDGESKGTLHMINYMKALNKPVKIILFDK